MDWFDANEAEKKGDRIGAAKLRTEAMKKEDQIDLMKEDRPKNIASIKVDSLQAVGGGGGIGQAGDSGLKQLERQTNVLLDIQQNIRIIAGKTQHSETSHAQPK